MSCRLISPLVRAASIILSAAVGPTLFLSACTAPTARTGYVPASPVAVARPKAAPTSTREMPQRGGLFEAEVARAARESRFVVVDFGAPWCGPCKVMERTTWTDSRVRRWIDANAIRVHIDIEQRSDVKNRFAVGGVPTTVVLWNGREVGRTSGALGGEAMVEWLRSTTRRS